MALPGYCIGDLVEDAEFLAANERAMHKVAAAARGITTVVGFVDVDPTARNDNGTIRSTTPRRSCVTAGSCSGRASLCCPTIGISTTSDSSRRPIAAIRWISRYGAAAVRLGVSICEDMWDEFYDVKPLAELSRKGASVLLNLNASPFYPGKRHIRDRLIRAHIRTLAKPILYVNTIGAATTARTSFRFDGESLVYDAHGRLVAIGQQFPEDLVMVDIWTRRRAERADRAAAR